MSIQGVPLQWPYINNLSHKGVPGYFTSILTAVSCGGMGNGTAEQSPCNPGLAWTFYNSKWFVGTMSHDTGGAWALWGGTWMSNWSVDGVDCAHVS